MMMMKTRCEELKRFMETMTQLKSETYNASIKNMMKTTTQKNTRNQKP
jgi:hypothetical protein